MTELLKHNAVEAAKKWFEDNFDGTQASDRLVLGVLQAYAASLPASAEATSFVDKDGKRWRLVPEHPNKEMQHAGLRALSLHGLGDCDCDQVAVWRAMIECAPAPLVREDDLGLEGRKLLGKADRFYFGKNTYGYDVWVAARGNGHWGVWNGSSCFSREGLWMYEPLASSRDEGYLSETRYTLGEAIKQAERALVTPRPEF